jgi:hypothetical protein
MNLNFNNTYDWSKVVKNNNGLWLALWDNKPDYRPKTDWSLIAMKQYGAIKVNGISGNVDGNNFFGDVETFKKYGVKIEQPPQEPVMPPEQTECEKEITNLKTENEGLKQELTASKSEIEQLKNENSLKNERIVFLEQTVKDREEELITFDMVRDERDRLEQEKLALQEENSKLKNRINNNPIKIVIEFITKLLKK